MQMHRRLKASLLNKWLLIIYKTQTMIERIARLIPLPITRKLIYSDYYATKCSKRSRRDKFAREFIDSLNELEVDGASYSYSVIKDDESNGFSIIITVRQHGIDNMYTLDANFIHVTGVQTNCKTQRKY